MLKRRNFLKWLFPATVAATIPPLEAVACVKLADQYAAALANERGGEWTVIDEPAGGTVTFIKTSA